MFTDNRSIKESRGSIPGRYVARVLKLALVAGALAVLPGISAAAFAHGADPSVYIAPLSPINHSGVTGFGRLTLSGSNLNVKINARGLVPGQVHPQHIHGKVNGEDATCPTLAQDDNHDGLVSVVEGADTYGPIKLNLTNPPTPFGPSPSPALFTPFAGTPNLGDFPNALNGTIEYNTSIPFDSAKPADVAAFNSLMPLENQHIVIHGAMAPQSVDTPGGSNSLVYDALLPVTCGQIIKVHEGSGNGLGETSEVGTGQQNTGISIDQSNSVTGPNSINSNNTSVNQTSSTSVRSNSRLQNRVAISTNTGNNHSNQNTFGGSILTGSIDGFFKFFNFNQ